jgi:TolB-like protein/Tfp pilus assembly protein PilF
MYTDMVGYTALGQRNESLALALVEEQRKLLRPIFIRHNGREVKAMGDGFLVEFRSALDAVRCAYDIQRATREFNISLSEDRRVHLRVGIHLGDVVEFQGDISGDAVNVASRIESLAEDGGVCLSRQVHDHVENKFELQLASLGTKLLKNVGAPVEVYKMVMPWGGEKTIPATVFNKRRIAVLPFANISPDPADEYFADGMTEELISTMSRISGLKVIARTSVMGYKGMQKKIKEVAKELEVGTVLEGSVRKAGDKLRITVQLIDSQTSDHLWAESYDRELRDVFAIQSDISKTVAEALKVQLLSLEKSIIEEKQTANPEAYTLYLKGRHYWNERNPNSIRKAMQYFEKAMAKDPDFSLAYVGLANCYIILMDLAVVETNEALPKAKALLDKALKMNDKLAEAHASLANLLTVEWNWRAAEAEFKRAIDLNPNYATAHHWYGLLLAFTGRPEMAVDEMKVALHLDPVSPIVGLNLALRLTEAGRFEEGIEQLKRTLELEPDFGPAHVHLGATYVSRAQHDEGIAELQKGHELMGTQPWTIAFLGYTYGLMGERKKAKELLRELEAASKNTFVQSPFFGLVHFALGDKEAAFQFFVKAYEERSNALLYVKILSLFREIRADPKFGALLEQIGR